MGVDGISPRLLRLSTPVLAEEVTKLIDYFIINHTWPLEWECSNITPVFKKQDSYKARVQRELRDSIVLFQFRLTALSKIYEKILFDQMNCVFIVNFR